MGSCCHSFSVSYGQPNSWPAAAEGTVPRRLQVCVGLGYVGVTAVPWTAQYNTWLLIKLTTKGAVVFVLSVSLL